MLLCASFQVHESYYLAAPSMVKVRSNSSTRPWSVQIPLGWSVLEATTPRGQHIDSLLTQTLCVCVFMFLYFYSCILNVWTHKFTKIAITNNYVHTKYMYTYSHLENTFFTNFLRVKHGLQIWVLICIKEYSCSTWMFHIPSRVETLKSQFEAMVNFAK